MVAWGSAECRKQLSEGCEAVHLFGSVDYRRIITSGSSVAAETFFETLARSGVRLLYVDHCNSVQVIGEAREVGLNAVVAATENLEVTYANGFARAFYSALGRGLYVSQAFEDAKRYVAVLGIADDVNPIWSPSRTRSGRYEPMFLDMRSDFRFGEAPVRGLTRLASQGV